MAELKPITSLGLEAPRREDFGVLTIAENCELGLSSLTLRRGAKRPKPFQLSLPDAGKWNAGNRVAALWLGPGQWMIEAEGRANNDFAQDLRIEAPDCSISEQTDGWAVFELSSHAGGAALTNLMQKLVNIDAESFTTGCATRTLLDHMSVILIRRADDRLAILGSRSAAASLWHALTTAAERLAANRMRKP